LIPLFTFLSLAAHAQMDENTATPNPESDFPACIALLSEKATTAGVAPQVIDTSLGRAKFSARVLELDRQQPEFTTTFADYLNRRVTEQRIKQGRKLLAEHRPLLDKVAQEYGVPVQYLVSFWG